MANLVIKSNTANKAFNISQKVFKFPFSSNKVELVISAKASYLINASDFKSGVLPPQVSKVEFSSEGTKVIAILFMSRNIDSAKNMILNIPIEGKAILKVDSFNIIDTTNVNGNILVSNSSPFSKSVSNNQTKYLVRNALGKKSLVFSKTFTTIGSSKFSIQPSYKILQNAGQYSVAAKRNKDTSGNIVSKTFDFYYSSPKNITASIDTEISFTATSQDNSPSTYNKPATSAKEFKIYSVNKGREIGPEGGVKKIVVKGVTGSEFEVLISNSDGKMYDLDTGNFSDNGGVIKGIIPIPRKGMNYGEATVNIRIPRSIGAQTITTEFNVIEDLEIAKAKLRDVSNEGMAQALTPVRTTQAKALSLTTPILTFGVTTTNYLGPKVKIISSGETVTSTNVFLGKEGREELTFKKPGQFTFAFTVSAAAVNKVVQLTRQPLFTLPIAPNDNYLAWDSDTAKKILAQQADGTPIPSDWDWDSVQASTSVKMRLKCVGVGKILSTDAISGVDHYSYAQVNVSGEIIVGNVGVASSTTNLRLDNFLTVITPS